MARNKSLLETAREAEASASRTFDAYEGYLKEKRISHALMAKQMETWMECKKEVFRLEREARERIYKKEVEQLQREEFNSMWTHALA